MSLAYLNKDKDIPQDYREKLTGTEKPVRVAIKIAQEHDNPALGEWYTAIGTRRHNNGEELTRETVAASLADAGLPACRPSTSTAPPSSDRSSARSRAASWTSPGLSAVPPRKLLVALTRLAS